MARTGRPRQKDEPKSVNMSVRATVSEYEDIKTYSEKHNQTITETLVQGFKMLKEQEETFRTN